MSKKDKEPLNQNDSTKNQEVNTEEAILEATTQESIEMGDTEALEDELAKEKDKFLRLFAEFENYKKRTTKERLELYKTANQDVMVSLLPVLDDFERALLQLAKTEGEETLKGVTLISDKLNNILKNKGLEPVQTVAGDAFNADVHEAITQIPAPSEEMKGKIIDIVERGYKLGDKIIRHPKVVVGQ